MKYYLGILFALLCWGCAWAGTAESHAASDLVNKWLTPGKIMEWEKDPAGREKLAAAARQKVFWKGRVLNWRKAGGYVFWDFFVDGASVQAVADASSRNLDYMRTGCTVAVKASPVLDGKGRFYFLDVWSVILLESPGPKKDYGDVFIFEDREMRSPYYHFTCNWIEMHNPHYSRRLIEEIAGAIIGGSSRCGLDPRLVLSLMTVESALDTGAVSWSGARGLGQLMPGTAAGLGVNPDDVPANIDGSCRYLSSMKNIWSHRSDAHDLALASYNAGPGNVRKYGGVPPFSETRNYILFINSLYAHICRNT